MKKTLKLIVFALLCVVLVIWLIVMIEAKDFVVLRPKGLIGVKQRDLIIIAISLMCLVVLPAVMMTLIFAWKFREGNKKAKYTPNWDHSHVAESIWWGVPFAIIIVLCVITWKSTHELDPYRPIEHDADPMKIQVVALQWKWLFIYPEQNIAVVNFVQFPEQVPLVFEITSDAPMNSFWIPQLGGQIYAMPGMKTKLHLLANEAGTFRGSSSNLSGTGFAGMTFKAKATSQEEFDQWVKSVKQSPHDLEQDSYDQLALPSEYNPVVSYVLKDEGLFERIVMKPLMHNSAEKE